MKHTISALLFILSLYCTFYFCSLGETVAIHSDWRTFQKDNLTVLPCGTTEFYRMKALKRGINFADSCMQGSCDTPTVRNSAKTDLKTVKLVVHVFNDDNGNAPNGVDLNLLNRAVATLRQDFASYGFDFFLAETIFHDDSVYHCIPPYSDIDPSWFFALEDMKDQYAVDPVNYLNIYVTCQEPSKEGTILLGIATFPWDPDALTKQGGLWVNSISLSTKWQDDRDKTLEHEMGHNLGLWHTFHGVSEVVGCNDPCRETVHELTDPKADTVGDLCADTPATPVNFYCKAPSGTDCNRKGWGNTDFANFMGYSQLPKPGCQNHFTDCQELRMHCWTCAKLRSQLRGSVQC